MAVANQSFSDGFASVLNSILSEAEWAINITHKVLNKTIQHGKDIIDYGVETEERVTTDLTIKIILVIVAVTCLLIAAAVALSKYARAKTAHGVSHSTKNTHDRRQEEMRLCSQDNSYRRKRIRSNPSTRSRQSSFARSYATYVHCEI